MTPAGRGLVRHLDPIWDGRARRGQTVLFVGANTRWDLLCAGLLQESLRAANETKESILLGEVLAGDPNASGNGDAEATAPDRSPDLGPGSGQEQSLSAQGCADVGAPPGS